MSELPPLPFFQQRLVFFALLFGMAMFAVVVAVVLQTGDGTGLGGEPMPMLDMVSIALGAAMAVAAFVARGTLQRRAAAATGAARSHARFRATLVPLALLEGGVLFCLTVWLLNGVAVPPLVVALVLFAAAIAIVPLHDPDAGA
jgi:hypothetical protein